MKLTKSALRALSTADKSYGGKSLGTHPYNLGAHYTKLAEFGLIDHLGDFVHLTDAGRAALRPYYEAGGKKA